MNYKKSSGKEMTKKQNISKVGNPASLKDKTHGRKNLLCNPLTGLEKLDATFRFEKWMRSRGDFYKNLKMYRYMDGEPYFESQGAEMSLSDFLAREKELTEKTL